MNSIFRFTSCALASCFYATYPIERLARSYRLRFTGAGFVGTLAGVATSPLLPTDPARCALFLLGCVFLSAVVSDVAEQSFGRKDDQRIVIDEWLGYLIAVALLPRTLVVMVTAFVLFRLLDTFKPLGIGRLGNLPGGWGVILDDVAAGLLANAILRLLPLH